MKTFKEFLQEKLILYNKGKPYGQIVFLAGGAGSGKDFSMESFMEYHKFKVFDVDRFKVAFLKLAQIKNKYPELQNLNLKNPNDVSSLHVFVKKLGVKDKAIDLMMSNANQGRLPNIIFNVTLKDLIDVNTLIPRLIEIGYEAKDIHLTWVLTDYKTAVMNNKTRDRIVLDDILLDTHEGAAMTMDRILKGSVPYGLDGEIRVILNNRENTIRSAIKPSVIEDFTYITVKQSGKKIMSYADSMKQLYQWITQNIPKTDKTKAIFGLTK